MACPGVWAPSPPTVFRLRPGGFLWISAIRRAASDSKPFVFYLIFHVIFSFVTDTGRYFMLLMWTCHVGSCMWYYLVRTEDPTIELAWSFEQAQMLVSWWWAETMLDRLVVLVRDILHGSVIRVTFVADAAPQCNRDDSVAMYPCLRMGLC